MDFTLLADTASFLLLCMSRVWFAIFSFDSIQLGREQAHLAMAMYETGGQRHNSSNSWNKTKRKNVNTVIGDEVCKKLKPGPRKKKIGHPNHGGQPSTMYAEKPSSLRLVIL